MIRFSGNIEFRNGSTVQVVGKYGLSITSQNGHILIETDIDMTCTEKVPGETCLGGFTQSSIGPLEDLNNPPKLLYRGNRRCFYLPLSHLRLVFPLAFTLTSWEVGTLGKKKDGMIKNSKSSRASAKISLVGAFP